MAVTPCSWAEDGIPQGASSSSISTRASLRLGRTSPRDSKADRSRWKIWIQWATDYRERNDGTSDLPNDTEELVKLGELLGIKKRSGESEAQYRKRVFEANQRRIENL